jgi:hypothetical protein
LWARLALQKKRLECLGGSVENKSIGVQEVRKKKSALTNAAHVPMRWICFVPDRQTSLWNRRKNAQERNELWSTIDVQLCTALA